MTLGLRFGDFLLYMLIMNLLHESYFSELLPKVQLLTTIIKTTPASFSSCDDDAQ